MVLAIFGKLILAHLMTRSSQVFPEIIDLAVKDATYERLESLERLASLTDNNTMMIMIH